MDRKFTVLLILALFINFGLMPRATAETKGKEKKEEKKSISQLIQELKSDKKLTRACAAEELGDRKDKSAVPYLIESLGDKEWTVKWQACMALGKIKDKSAVPGLIGRLKDKKENWSIQTRAAEALANIGDIAAFRPLTSTLEYECKKWREKLDPPIPKSVGSDDEALELKIAISLYELSISSKSIYIPLLLKEIKATKKMSKFRYYLATILGKLGEKKVVPVLIEYLKKSENGLFREKCARILGDLGDKRAVGPLKEALKDDFVCVSTGDVRKVYGYTVRLTAYCSLKKLGTKVEKKGDKYKVIE